MAEYTLPELGYDYAALEPSISGKIMQLHHDKHHQGYVTGANTALAKLAEARDAGDFANVNKLEKDLAFNLSGHINHTIFWTNLSPNGGDKPTGELAAAIDDNFGSFDKFVGHFTAASAGIQGSGWGALVWDSLGGKLLVQQYYDHQNNFTTGSVPLLLLDMWEHAFYLDYLNVKTDYIKGFWKIANWANVQERFEAARQQTKGLIA
jgi:Fe-Mn family superoxide dismutase